MHVNTFVYVDYIYSGFSMEVQVQNGPLNMDYCGNHLLPTPSLCHSLNQTINMSTIIMFYTCL